MGKEKKEHIIEVVLIKVQSKYTRKNNFSKSYVVPGHQEAEVGNEIIFKMEDTSGEFYFPDKALFGKRKYRVKKGGSLSLEVQEEAKGKEFPYTVLTDNNDFAEGGSFPRIIIK